VFLTALFPDPDLFVHLYLAYVTTSASSGTGNTRLDLSVMGRAFEADVGRGWAAKAEWRWEDENSVQWEPVRGHQCTPHGPRPEAPGRHQHAPQGQAHPGTFLNFPQCVDVNCSLET
jgi:hypothetical protein